MSLQRIRNVAAGVLPNDVAIVAQLTGGGGGSVTSVNAKTGVVVLGAADVGADASGAAAAAQAASDPVGSAAAAEAAAIAASQAGPLTGDVTTSGAVATLGTHAASSKTTPVDADEIPIADSAASYGLKKLTWANLKATVKTYTDTLYPAGSGTSTGTNTGDQTSVSGNAGTATKLVTARNIDGQSFDGTAAITVIAPGTHAATGKTTPVDADELPIVDSAASNVLKKLTWANLKATLKTYFDGIYVTTVFTRTGAVVAAAGDYTAAQVTNAADKIATSIQSFAGGIVSTHATQGVGYATGAGGTVSQATSKTTSVTLNKVCGQVTMNGAALAGSAAVAFSLTNSAIGANDVVVANIVSGYATVGTYTCRVLNIGNTSGPSGVTRLQVTNISGGSLSEALVINFVVIKGVSS